MLRSKLEAIRHHKFIGVAELANRAANILAVTGPVQDRGTVSEVPDERTVRYYLTEGLISPAEDKQGVSSIFEYLHLLQLLVVKKLQAEHLPIRKIREIVSGRSERELECLLGVDHKSATRNEALSYLETLLTSSSSAIPVPAASPHSYGAAPSQPLSSGLAQLPSSTPSGTWERIAIEPGLELHIHNDYEPPAEAKGLRRLAQHILRIIESHGKKEQGKRGK